MWVPGKIISATAQRSARARRSMQPEQLRRTLRDRAKSFFSDRTFDREEIIVSRFFSNVPRSTSSERSCLKLFSNVYCAAHYFLV